MTRFSFLRQPYPRTESVPGLVRRAVLIGVFVGTFLLLFQPFGLSEWTTPYKAYKILGFGLVTTAVLLVTFVALPRLLPNVFRESHWTVGRAMLYVLLHMTLIAVANRYYISWVLNRGTPIDWLWTLGMTYLIGIFPTVGAITANYIIQLRRYTRDANALSAQLAPSSAATSPDSSGYVTVENSTITLVADNEKDALTVATADLLAIESSDNYCTVFQQRGGTLAKELMRSSLSRLEGQLASQSPGTFLRCHRSYVVNVKAVERVSGNAQGYKLHLNNGQLVVPVARKYNDSLPVRP